MKLAARGAAFVLTVLLLTTVAPATFAAPPAKSLRPFVVSDTVPAKSWIDAFPIGNGRLGAMPFGDYPDERILINDGTVWLGRSEVRKPPADAAQTVKEIREALFKDDFKTSERLLNGKLLALRPDHMDYQPIGYLHLRYGGQERGGKPKDYRRTLSLNDAVAVSEFTAEDGNQIHQEVIASHPADVIAIRVESRNGRKLSLAVGLDRFKYLKTMVLDDLTLGMSGVAQVDGKFVGTAWQAVARVLPEGGTTSGKADRITVDGASAVTILVTTSTDYDINNPMVPLRHDRQKACLDALDRIQSIPYARLKAENTKEHRAYFDRAMLDLGTTPPEVAARTTQERINLVRQGGEDPDLIEDLFQMGRYLLISASRPGNLPANLIGLWQGDEFTTCWADFHFNIDVQENYWPAELTNMSELHAPFFDFIESARTGDGRRCAANLGCRGFVMKVENTAWKDQEFSGSSWWGIFVQNAAWACEHVMEHYYFTRDKVYLKDRAYPILKANVEFLVDWLVKDPRTGKLVSGPSASPENGFYPNSGDKFMAHACMGPAIDQEIIAESFTDFLAAAKELGIEDELTRQVRQSLQELASPQIAPDGRLMEWDKDYKGYEDGHRHFSHIYGVYPGCTITPDTPALFEAARKSVQFRVDHGGAREGWSRAWLVNIQARLLEGENAYQNVLVLLKKHTLRNLMHTQPPIFFDGQGAGTAGIAEMLLQSQRPDHVVLLLPALPKAWKTGSFSGLCARGGFDLDLVWKDGRPLRLTVLSKAGEEFRLKAADTVTVSCDGVRVKHKINEAGVASFATHTGKTYKITFAASETGTTEGRDR
jgi:alpha-L-fucosidase 2